MVRLKKITMSIKYQMKYGDVIKLCFRHLTRIKSRTLLTVSGVAIGVGAIVLLVSLGIGLQKVTTEQIATADALTTIDASIPSDSKLVLDDQLIQEVEEKVKNIEQLSPSISLPARVTGPVSTTSAIVSGIRPDQLELESVKLIEGEAFGQSEGVVLTKQLVTTLGHDSSAEIINKEVSFQIIQGQDEDIDQAKVAKLKTSVTGISDNEEIGAAYLSASKLKETLGIEDYDSLKVKLRTQNNVKAAQEELEKLGFKVSAISDLIDRINQVFLIIEILLGAIGAIGLFIASLGIINTMTISLLERTHEIGIMKCVGASNRDIKRIFNFEAIFISCIGGILGIMVGLLIGGIFNAILSYLMSRGGVPGEMAISVSPWPFILAVLIFSLIIGWVAGWYPARRAAKLSPFEALRSE